MAINLVSRQVFQEGVNGFACVLELLVLGCGFLQDFFSERIKQYDTKLHNLLSFKTTFKIPASYFRILKVSD